MQILKINNNVSFGIERDEKKVRLVVFDKEEELACRKETVTNLMRFIESGEAHIFKGRLQLYKKSELIEIQLQRKKLGSVSAGNFEKCLSHLIENKK